MTTIRGVKFTSVTIDEAIRCWTITTPIGATFQVFDGTFTVPAEARKLRAAPRPRIPNVALSVRVPVADEARVAPSKRSVLVTLPPGAALDPNEEHFLTTPDGSRWRLDVVSAHEVVAREV